MILVLLILILLFSIILILLIRTVYSTFDNDKFTNLSIQRFTVCKMEGIGHLGFYIFLAVQIHCQCSRVILPTNSLSLNQKILRIKTLDYTS